MQEKIHLQGFPVQNSRFQRVVFVGQLQREKGTVLVDEAEENLVAFPHGEVQQALLLDPLQVAFVAFDLLAGPVGADEDMHVLVIVDVVHKSDDTAIAPLGDGEAGLLPHLA